MASNKTVVKGIRASQEFFDKCDLVAKAEGVDRNKLIVRVVGEYCDKVESTITKQMEKCLNGEMLMSGIVRPIRAKDNENGNKECSMCGSKLSKVNYYTVFDIEQNKNLEFCCRDCFERYKNIMKEIEREENVKDKR